MDEPINAIDKELSEEEIRQISEKILNGLRTVAEKLTDEKLPKRLPKQDLQSVGDILKYFQTLGKQQSLLSNATLPKDFKNQQQVLLADKFLNDLFGLKTNNPVEEILPYLNPKLVYDKISSNTEYTEKMQNSIHQIFYEMEKVGRLNQFTKLINSFTPEYAFASIQGAERLNKNLKYILKIRKRFTRRIVENYINIYKEVSGFIETPIAVLFGMNLIIKNKYKSFIEIKNNYLTGHIVNELKQERLFLPLIVAYNPQIRNSIMHSTHSMNFVKRIIEFVDKKGKTDMSYEEFILYVQEITRLAVLLSRIESELQYLQFLGYKQRREQIRK